jgi:nitrogen fixation protein FixH
MMVRGITGQAHGDRWIPWAFIAFFGVVLLANAAMIWIAFATWTGLETESAYQKGLAYNRAIEEAEAQAALGWRVGLSLAQPARRTLSIELTLADPHGDMIEDASVNAALVRPTHGGYDQTIGVPHRYGGSYGTEVELPLAGQWDLGVRIEAAGEVWHGKRRVYLKP